MKSLLTKSFGENEPARSALLRLQAEFSAACNFLAPIAAERRCWSRVGLHHLAYRSLRQNFPELGSQMSCNAIYAVSKVAGLVYRPGGLGANSSGPLSRLQFSAASPVFFDRHTLSVRAGSLSIYTVDGRIRVRIEDVAAVESLLMGGGLKDIILFRSGDGFRLRFICGERDFEELEVFKFGGNADAAHSSGAREIVVA
jgi:hypothetical protein